MCKEIQEPADVVRVDVRADDQVKPTPCLCKLRQVRGNVVLVRTGKTSVNEEIPAAGIN